MCFESNANNETTACNLSYVGATDMSSHELAEKDVQLCFSKYCKSGQKRVNPSLLGGEQQTKHPNNHIATSCQLHHIMAGRFPRVNVTYFLQKM